jgi:hypothetical protein
MRTSGFDQWQASCMSLRGQYHIRWLWAVEDDLGFDSAEDFSDGFDIEAS